VSFSEFAFSSAIWTILLQPQNRKIIESALAREAAKKAIELTKRLIVDSE